MNRKVWMKILVFLLTAVATLSCAESPEIVYAPEQTVLTLEECHACSAGCFRYCENSLGR